MTTHAAESAHHQVAPTLGDFACFGKEFSHLVQNPDFVSAILDARTHLRGQAETQGSAMVDATTIDAWFPYNVGHLGQIPLIERQHSALREFWRILESAAQACATTKDEDHYAAFTTFVTELLQQKSLLERQVALNTLHFRNEASAAL